jgi:hypothetical protein
LRYFATVAVDLAIDPCLAAADKSQVFALKLNRRKFAKKPIDLIRCKFSIDGGLARKKREAGRIHHFETIPGRFWKPEIHHLHRMVGLEARENPANIRSLAMNLRALAFA